MNDDDLVAGYLGRLVQAARQLPPDRRAELIDEIADHIEQARAVSEAPAPAPPPRRRRLGEPEATAAAARDSAGDFAGAFGQPAPAITQPPAGRGPGRQRRLDLAAVTRTLGRGLRVNATAPDGIIEGFEDPSLPLFLALQWHPENLTAASPEHLAPFARLVSVAEAQRTRS